jgi:putative ABC transport system substrate-binding protein
MSKTGELRTDPTRRSVLLQAGALLLAPLAAAAQEAKRSYRIGVLTPAPRQSPNYVALFDELRRSGFAEGENLLVVGRGFASRSEQFPEFALELAAAGVDAILCGGDDAIRAARQATKTIPIVGVTDDMVGAGLVQSLARPGSNITGISILASELDGKRQELLIELAPGVRRMAALADPHTTPPRQARMLQDAARARGVDLSVHWVGKPEELAGALDDAVAAGARALNVLATPLLNAVRRPIMERAAAQRMPAIYQWPETAVEGGLIAYGPWFFEVGRQQAPLLVKVLRGAKPADLPVQQPIKFDLVINLKTAKAMGLEVPPEVLTLVDRAIE